MELEGIAPGEVRTHKLNTTVYVVIHASPKGVLRPLVGIRGYLGDPTK
jgi:hypothetical protein